MVKGCSERLSDQGMSSRNFVPCAGMANAFFVCARWRTKRPEWQRPNHLKSGGGHRQRQYRLVCTAIFDRDNRGLASHCDFGLRRRAFLLSGVRRGHAEPLKGSRVGNGVGLFARSQQSRPPVFGKIGSLRRHEFGDVFNFHDAFVGVALEH